MLFNLIFLYQIFFFSFLSNKFSDLIVLFLALFILSLIYVAGMLGFLVPFKSFLHYLYLIELMKISVCFIFIIFFLFFKQIELLIFCLLLLAVAATESAIGLALLINYHNVQFSSNLSVEHLKFLRK